MLSFEEYEVLQETVYLLQRPTDTKQLVKATKALEARRKETEIDPKGMPAILSHLKMHRMPIGSSTLTASIESPTLRASHHPHLPSTQSSSFSGALTLLSAVFL